MEPKRPCYKITSPKGIQISNLQSSDILPIHKLLEKEGCVASENLFTMEQAIDLDGIQTRIAQRNHKNKIASMDMLVCLAKKKYLLCDAKFNCSNVSNISKKEIKDKVSYSRSLVLSEEFIPINISYLLFREKVLTPTAYNKLKRLFDNRPNVEFCNAKAFFLLMKE